MKCFQKLSYCIYQNSCIREKLKIIRCSWKELEKCLNKEC